MVLKVLIKPCGAECGDFDDELPKFKSKTHDEWNPNFPDIPVLECDFDTTYHALFNALQKRDWDRAAALLQLEEEKSLTELESREEDVFVLNTSVEDMDKQEVLARTWIMRKDEFGIMKWRILPIHAAVMFDAPVKIVDKLLRIHPDGAKLKDDNGNLPLHLCYSNGSLVEKAELIRKAYPEGAAIKNNKGLTPGENLGSGVAERAVRMIKLELEETHRREIAKKDETITAMKESHEAKLKALAMDNIQDLETVIEANQNEISVLREELKKIAKENENALDATVHMITKKDREIEKLKLALVQQKMEIQVLKHSSSYGGRVIQHQEVFEKCEELLLSAEEKGQQLEERTPASEDSSESAVRKAIRTPHWEKPTNDEEKEELIPIPATDEKTVKTGSGRKKKGHHNKKTSRTSGGKRYGEAPTPVRYITPSNPLDVLYGASYDHSDHRALQAAHMPKGGRSRRSMPKKSFFTKVKPRNVAYRAANVPARVSVPTEDTPSQTASVE